MKKILQPLIPNLKFALLAIFFYHLLYINAEIYADYWDEKSFWLSEKENWWLIKKQYWIDWSDYDRYGRHNILYFLPYTHSMLWGEFVFYVFIGLIFFIYVIFGIMDKIQAILEMIASNGQNSGCFLFSYLDNIGNSLTFASSV